jgi:uncharacterized phiE125 gp8 family phage protein
MTGDLATLADVKAWLGLTQGADDALLARLITAASEDIRQETERVFHPSAYDEFYNGAGWEQTILVTRQWPIISVASLTIDGNQIPAQPGANQRGYVFRNSASAGKIVLAGYEFTSGSENVELAYTAGYADGSGNFLPPADLAQAAIDLVAYRYTGKSRIGQRSKTLAGETVSFITDHYPDSVQRVIQRYRRVIPA